MSKYLPISRNSDPIEEFLSNWNTISLLRKALPFEVSTSTVQSVLSDKSRWHLMLPVKWLYLIFFHIQRCEYYVLRGSLIFWKCNVDGHVIKLSKKKCTLLFKIYSILCETNSILCETNKQKTNKQTVFFYDSASRSTEVSKTMVFM